MLHLLFVVVEAVGVVVVVLDGVGDGELREVGERLFDSLGDEDTLVLEFARRDSLEELIVLLGDLDVGDRQNGFEGVPGPVGEPVDGRRLDDPLDDVQHVGLGVPVLLVLRLLVARADVGDVEAEDGAVLDGVLDGVLVEAAALLSLAVELPVELVRGSSVAVVRVLVLLESRGAGEAVPKAVLEELPHLEHPLRRDGPVAFVHNEGDSLGFDRRVELVRPGLMLADELLDEDVQLLDRGDDQLLVLVVELESQISGRAGVLHVDDVVGAVGKEGPGGLVVEVLSVHEEDGLLDGRDVVDEVSGGLVGGERLARSGRVPYVTGHALLGGLFDALDGVDLVGAEGDDSLRPCSLVLFQDGVSRDHVVGHRPLEDEVREGIQVGDDVVPIVSPLGQMRFGDVVVGPGGEVFRHGGVGDDEELHEAEDPVVAPLSLIFLNLLISLVLGHGLLLKLNLYQRKAVDEERDVESSVFVHAGALRNLDLVDDLVDVLPEPLVAEEEVEDDGLSVPLDVYVGDPVLPDEVFGGVEVGGKGELVPDLLEFLVAQRDAAQRGYIVLVQDFAQVVPHLLDSVDVGAVFPLVLDVQGLNQPAFYV